MPNHIVCFSIPKIGENEGDIQDACYYSDDNSLVAIADGTSTSFLAREWAKLLVEHFCKNQFSIDTWKECLKPAQDEWRTQFLKIKQDRTIPWYVKGSKENDHGSATFVGLKLHPPNEQRNMIYETIVIGDSCLFHFQPKSNESDDFFNYSYPITHSRCFKTITECFHSLPEYNSFSPKSQKGFYSQGDIFILATDALSKCILENLEKGEEGNETLKELINLSIEAEFNYFISKLRSKKGIDNDDTTFCRLKIDAITPTKKSAS